MSFLFDFIEKYRNGKATLIRRTLCLEDNHRKQSSLMVKLWSLLWKCWKYRLNMKCQINKTNQYCVGSRHHSGTVEVEVEMTGIERKPSFGIGFICDRNS